MRGLYNMHASRFDGSSFSDKNGTHSDATNSILRMMSLN